MRLPRHRPTTVSSLILFLLLPSLTTAVSIDCSDVREDDTSWNFKELDGPHSLYRISEEEAQIINTTFTFNICRPLGKTKGVPKEEDCPASTIGNDP